MAFCFGVRSIEKKNMQANVSEARLQRDAHGIKHLLKHHARALYLHNS